jgi:uroporphyrinogen-III synthase
VRILVTRPSEEAERTAATLRALGHDVMLAPMLTIEPVRDAGFGAGPFAAVLLTSGNAARALMQHPERAALAALPAFAVGAQTAAAAKQAGFSDVLSADGDGADLVRLVAAHIADRAAPLLYLAGSDRARDIGGELARGGINVVTAIIYRACAAPVLPDHARSALARNAIDGVLHFSRRSAAVFVDCAAASGLSAQIRSLTHFCLSARASEPLQACKAADIRIAPHPDEAALVGLLPRG